MKNRYRCPERDSDTVNIVARAWLNGTKPGVTLAAEAARTRGPDRNDMDAECAECGYESSVGTFDTMDDPR